jgi:hypothetical protein
MRFVLKYRIVFLLFVFSSSAVYGQPKNIKVRVDSSWGGLGAPASSHFNQTVQQEHAASLIRAIKKPPLKEPDASNLGVTSTWLRSHADKAGTHMSRIHYAEGTEQQKDLFKAAFADKQTLGSRLKDVYAGFHTDDYPHIRVRIWLDDGTVISLKTDSQNPFMLPWQISSNGTVTKTYNANISRALYALLPENFTNCERLISEQESSLGLLGMLATETENAIESQWNLLGAEQVAPDALSILRRAYKVRRAEVNSYHNLNYGKEWSGGEPHEENLDVDLWRPGFPKNFVTSAILLRDKGATQGVDSVSERAALYEKLVLSIKWLTDYFADHPQENAWLFYVHGESLTDKGMQIFAADMNGAGHPELVERVRPVMHQAALLETGFGDYWIILPDKSAVLWRWDSLSHILNWKPSQLPAHECTAYSPVSGGCAGVVISPQGHLLP